MQNKTKKIISAFLTLAMILGLFWAMAIPASAKTLAIKFTKDLESQEVFEGATVTFVIDGTVNNKPLKDWIASEEGYGDWQYQKPGESTWHIWHILETTLTVTATKSFDGVKFRYVVAFSDSKDDFVSSAVATLTVKDKPTFSADKEIASDLVDKILPEKVIPKITLNPEEEPTEEPTEPTEEEPTEEPTEPATEPTTEPPTETTEPPPPPKPFPFTDVVSTDWFYNNVKTAWEMGLVNGKTPTTYEPTANLTYAEAVKLAACMYQYYKEGKVTLDIGTINWYDTYVAYAKENHIISKDYNWNTNATRAGYMEIFANALPDEALGVKNIVTDGSIPDVPESHAQAAAIYKLYRAGIVQGVDNVTHACNPDSNIQRSEVAAIIDRMMNPASRVVFTLG
ncbi:MAG: S-layer homology domain-containing protein [Oscillospiraceae bacterium]|nr:S-layer homology domain-containing protein [Oscillospiraceae bacterium]